jgi:hypothetical protein
MKNGHLLDRASLRMVQARRILAVLLATGGPLVFLPVSARAGAPEPSLSDTRALDTPGNEKEGRIPTPTNLRECLDECEYQKGREDEACSRKKDPIKRKQCFAEANDKYAKCKRECHKKYPEK